MSSTKGWIVLKFGGTSVSTAQTWLRISNRVKELQSNHHVWIVVSALTQVTNLLLSAIKEAISSGELRSRRSGCSLRFVFRWPLLFPDLMHSFFSAQKTPLLSIFFGNT